MNLKLLLLDNANLQEKLANVFPLVTLKLNDLAVLGMLNHSTITGKFLFEGLHKLLLVIVVRDALDRGERLPAVSLLDPYMDVILSPRREQVVTLSGISEGVEGLEVLDSGHATLV